MKSISSFIIEKLDQSKYTCPVVFNKKLNEYFQMRNIEIAAHEKFEVFLNRFIDAAEFDTCIDLDHVYISFDTNVKFDHPLLTFNIYGHLGTDANGNNGDMEDNFTISVGVERYESKDVLDRIRFTGDVDVVSSTHSRAIQQEIKKKLEKFFKSYVDNYSRI